MDKCGAEEDIFSVLFGACRYWGGWGCEAGEAAWHAALGLMSAPIIVLR